MKESLLQHQMAAETISSPDRSQRERSDVADLERHLMQAQQGPSSSRFQRSTSWSEFEQKQRVEASPELRASNAMREPGGFRREFLRTRAETEGVPPEQMPDTWNVRLMDSFKSFGMLNIEGAYGLTFSDDADAQPPPSGASDLSVAFLIFKGNCGCAILYMPRAWMHGGLLLSSLLIPMVGAISIFCVLRLLHVRQIERGSYGDIMDRAVGAAGSRLANACIILLQSGVCCSYFIVVGELLQSTIAPNVSLDVLIALMAIGMIPLVAIRKVSALWPLSCLGTVLVISGVFVVLGYEIQQVVPIHRDDPLPLTNWNGFLVCIGQACFMFEGIGLVLPTFDSSLNPGRFPCIYLVVMAFVLTIVFLVGILGYLAYGQQVHNLVLLDFPQGTAVAIVRLAFMVQVLCSFPLQMLPAARLLENQFFTPVSNPSMPRKAAKTSFRAVFTAFLAYVAYLGADRLDNFVSLIGALCGVPLAFIFPALCHYKIVGSAKAIDGALIGFGLTLTVVVTVVNVSAFLS
eukprot:gb/GFBE01023359.1/.p1 GENE.gb/GFBE01023359.1/~~gb/GFBE01023359.1/.p1  ORF type:complete len:518 (+),score=84.14 gb/GFBE01023359.1/:1-1554(+)